MIEVPPIMAIHLAFAALALPLGAAMLIRRKGDRPHKLIGRAWVGLMAVVVVSSFWITGVNGDRWSAIHILSLVTLVSLIGGIVAIRNGRVGGHRYAMVGSCLGLIGAFAFTFLPGRLLGELVF